MVAVSFWYGVWCLVWLSFHRGKVSQSVALVQSSEAVKGRQALNRGKASSRQNADIKPISRTHSRIYSRTIKRLITLYNAVKVYYNINICA